MTIIPVQHVCGHMEEHDMMLSSDHSKWIALVAKDDCDDCAYAQKVQRASDWAIDQGLPQLRGSFKQIIWAEVLRHEVIIEAEDLRKQITPEAIERAPCLKLYDDFLSWLRQRYASQFWIDNRNMTCAETRDYPYPLETMRDYHWQERPVGASACIHWQRWLYTHYLEGGSQICVEAKALRQAVTHRHNWTAGSIRS